MSWAWLARRARGLRLRQLHALRQAAGGMAGSWTPPLGGGGSGGSLPPAAPAAGQLWRYDSPLLRHLSTAPEAAAVGPELPSYEQLQQRAAAAQRGDGGEAQPLLQLAPGEAAYVEGLLRNFKNSGAVKDQALALYVNSKVRLRGAAVQVVHCSQACPAAAVPLAAAPHPAALRSPAAAVRGGGAPVPGLAAGGDGRRAAGRAAQAAGGRLHLCRQGGAGCNLQSHGRMHRLSQSDCVLALVNCVV